MSSAPEPPNIKKEAPKEKDSRIPGLRGVRTTTLFRAVNPELFIKPVRGSFRDKQTCYGFWTHNNYPVCGLHWLFTCNTGE
ncbi:small integral membrane protein 8 isoform X2 [Terrapene carolina triunguis]|uniref:small integral membrane protein 8 isoform X2 n=1 Tax=Terrapene triunguis TaxID=2587831 RepID=UPI000CEF7AA1|nr:small integral membrane protein 8 isoform X2 [Terrapene carolina triunguis]